MLPSFTTAAVKLRDNCGRTTRNTEPPVPFTLRYAIVPVTKILCKLYGKRTRMVMESIEAKGRRILQPKSTHLCGKLRPNLHDSVTLHDAQIVLTQSRIFVNGQ